MREYSLFCRLLALTLLICVVQLVMLMIWSNQVSVPVNDKVTKFTSSTLREVRKLFRHNTSRQHSLVSEDLPTYNNRVAILVPYLGDKLPTWFQSFMLTATSSSSLCDWYIFVTEAPLIETPSNVKLIQLSREDIYNRLSRLDTKRYVNDAEFMQLSIKRLVEHHPYVLVEFKPCLGFLFNDYIQSYSHWAYADLDTLAGRVEEHLSQEHLNRFDIISYSFGDNYRLYLRGQLTIIRNSQITNNLWKECSQLSSLGARLDKFVQGASKVDTSNDKNSWRFQSAEGCFSRVAMENKNVSIIFLSSQLSDAFSAPTTQKESLLLGHSLVRCHSEGIDLRNEFDSVFSLMKSGVNKNRRYSVGYSEFINLNNEEWNNPLRQLHDVRCSYWIEPTFDVCVEELPSSSNVVKRVEAGHISLSRHTVSGYSVLGNGECREASIAHFQGWKHNYGSFVTRTPSSDAQIVLVTESGLIPLKVTALEPENANDSIKALPTFSQLYDNNVLFAGRLVPSDLQSVVVSSTNVVDNNLNSNLRTRSVDNPSEDNPSNARTISRWNGIGSNLNSRYCAGYSVDLKTCSCHLQYDDIEILQRESSSGKFKANAVSLVVVAWDFDLYDRSLDAILNGWDGPIVLVLAKTKASSHVPSAAKDSSILLVNLQKCLQFINQDAFPPHYLLPDKMLFNIGLDVVKTDLVLLLPTVFHSTRRVSLKAWKGSSAGITVQLRQQLQALNGNIPPSTEVFTVPNSIALVLPTYISVDEDEISDLSAEEQLLNPKAIPSLHNYPLSNSWCGESQPSSTQFSFEVLMEQLDQQINIPFNAKELLKEKTLMLPILFNMTAGPHGRDFVRFPDELSGHGCFGTSTLRILAGSGYSLHWSTGGAYLSIGNKLREAAPDGDFVLNEIACGCSFGNDVAAMKEFTTRMNSYYLRAVELRSKGIGSIFTGEPFGKQFEKNTMNQE